MTISQKQSERHQTSVFSQYENNSNNSISSKQLQLWLQQMAPTSHTSPKFGQDWNLMSTSSRYESDGMTFGARLDTFQSANKQNISVKANFAIEPSKSLIKQNHYQSLSQTQNSQKLIASKSYINAMKQLQKRAKTLEQDNSNMRKSLQIFQEQKRNSLQSSMIQSQQLKMKFLHFQQAEKRMQEMKKQNKKLRDSKNEQTQKTKLLQKSINEQKSKVKTFEERLEILSKENEDLKRELIESNNITKSLMVQNKQLAVKSETLSNLKEKSTNTVLEKYAKALERIEQLELIVGELKTKGNIMEEKQKKLMEEKDNKYFASLESMNSLKLEKEQLMMRLQSSSCELDSKSKQVDKLDEKVKKLEEQFLELNKQIFTLKSMILQKDDKIEKLTQRQTKIQKKYRQIKDKMQVQKQKYLQEIRRLRQKVARNSAEQCKSQSEDSIESDNIHQNFKEKYQDNISHLMLQNPNQEDTPVEKYNSADFDNHELEEFTTLAKPLSIIINAKNSQPKIKSEQAEPSDVQNNIDKSSEEEESLENQNRINIKPINQRLQNTDQTGYLMNRKSLMSKENLQQKKILNRQRKQTLKEPEQLKQKSKQSAKSSNSRKQSLHESKYMIPSSNSKKVKNQVKIIHQNSNVSSHNRSKSSSIEKKRTSEQKSISMDSKHNTISHKKSKDNTSQKANQMIKSNEPSQSRYVNERPDESCMYMSVEPTRYQSQHPQHYYYTNEINYKGIQQQQALSNHDLLLDQNLSIHGKSLIGKSENEIKKALNKALLLEYQKEALKLYEEHEKLLAMSEKQDITPQEKAQILGRTRQVMNMIDHNTQKIFNLKARAE